jgi:hypothetical protein
MEEFVQSLARKTLESNAITLPADLLDLGLGARVPRLAEWLATELKSATEPEQRSRRIWIALDGMDALSQDCEVDHFIQCLVHETIDRLPQVRLVFLGYERAWPDQVKPFLVEERLTSFPMLDPKAVEEFFQALGEHYGLDKEKVGRVLAEFTGLLGPNGVRPPGWLRGLGRALHEISARLIREAEGNQ